MAGSDYEKEISPGDPLAVANRPLDDETEPVDEEKAIASEAAVKDEEAGLEPITAESDRRNRPELDRIQSAATESSVATGVTSHHGPQVKSWYQKMNPLRWGSIPPVPEERGPSPEYTAGFFSKLIFTWQGPLMRVSRVTLRLV